MISISERVILFWYANGDKFDKEDFRVFKGLWLYLGLMPMGIMVLRSGYG